jgi:4,5-dihydroxyphthalate decarboxylase
MTAAVWIRGLLIHDFNVDLSKVTWIQGSINLPSPHGEPVVMPMYKPISINLNNTGFSLSDLLSSGKLDAVIGTTLPNSIKTNNSIVRLFPNFREIEKEYFKRTKVFPVMHLVVIKKTIYDKYPFIGKSLFDAFCDSKNIALTRMKNLAALRYMLPWLPDDLDEIEDILDIRIFSTMNTLLKEKQNAVKDEISRVEGELSIAKAKVEEALEL